jgi:hypothetical protein
MEERVVQYQDWVIWKFRMAAVHAWLVDPRNLDKATIRRCKQVLVHWMEGGENHWRRWGSSYAGYKYQIAYAPDYDRVLVCFFCSRFPLRISNGGYWISRASRSLRLCVRCQKELGPIWDQWKDHWVGCALGLFI